MQHARGGVKKHALYVGASDHIPSDYNSGMPRGSTMIGLLLAKKTVGLGACEPCNLGSNAYHSTQAAYAGHNDAIAVRDQFLWLPLGLAVAI